MGYFRRDKKPSTKSGGKSEEISRKFVLDCQAAEKIINQYGAVMEMTSQMVFGAPESLLPQPKDKIKEAIIMCLMGHHSQKSLDKKTFDLLKVGYVKLASFVSDADAKTAVAAAAAFKCVDPESIHKESKGDLEKLALILEEAHEISARRIKESKSLSDEFDAIVAKLGIQL